MAALEAPVAVTAGLRPFNPFRDLAGVTALLATVFGPELSLESRSTARLVRWMRRYPSIGWIWLGFDAWFDGTVSGFVWVEDGRLVGNANIAPVGYSGRWILSNVAVSEDRRGRGIGRSLVEACLSRARVSGAERVLLQVWEKNQAAVHLYRSLGFEEVGRVTRISITPGRGARPEQRISSGDLRWADVRPGDFRILAELAGAMVSSTARAVRPSPLVPFRSSWSEPFGRFLPRPSGHMVTQRRVLLRGRAPVAALAAVPVSDDLARVTILSPPGPAAEVAERVLAELERLAGCYGVSLLADVPASLDRLQAGMVERGWGRQDSLLQMTCDRSADAG